MMSDPFFPVFGSISTFIFLFLLVLAILWFILPFAIFGTKGRLDKLITETQKMNHQLALLIDSSDDISTNKTLEESNTQSVKDKEHNLNTEADRAKVLVDTLDTKKKDFSKNFKLCEVCQRKETGIIIDFSHICESCKTKYFS